LAEVKERLTVSDMQFRFAMMATEDAFRAVRGQKSPAGRGGKRIFRLPGDRVSARETGRR